MEYPNPIQEKVNLVKHQAWIRDEQTLLEGPPPYDLKHPRMEPMETIPEISESRLTSSPRVVVEEEMETISALKEEDADELWKEV